jgi:hypothetical protein
MPTVTIQSRIQTITFILILTLASGCFGTSSPLLGQQEGPPPDFQGPPPDDTSLRLDVVAARDNQADPRRRTA